MHVRNGLATMRAIVDDQAVARLVDFFAARDLGGSEQQMAKQRLLLLHSRTHTRNGQFGNYQNVNWSLRRDVTECQASIILKNNVGWYLPRDDFFKKRHVS